MQIACQSADLLLNSEIGLCDLQIAQVHKSPGTYTRKLLQQVAGKVYVGTELQQNAIEKSGKW